MPGGSRALALSYQTFRRKKEMLRPLADKNTSRSWPVISYGPLFVTILYLQKSLSVWKEGGVSGSFGSISNFFRVNDSNYDVAITWLASKEGGAHSYPIVHAHRTPTCYLIAR